MDALTSLPQDCEWLAPPHIFSYVGNSGQISECALSAVAKQDGKTKQIYVLCSELKRNLGTAITNAWGPAITLELQIKRHLLGEAGHKLDPPDDPILDGWHYHVSEQDVDGWHFFEHHGPLAGESAPHVSPVAIPFEDGDVLLGPRIDLSSEGKGSPLSAMTSEVETQGFALKPIPT